MAPLRCHHLRYAAATWSATGSSGCGEASPATSASVHDRRHARNGGSDHGVSNVEQMTDPSTGQAHTAHTCEPVPLVYVGDANVQFRADGILADVAPTLLTLMGLPVPQEMTGRTLIEGSERFRRSA
jgi:hypothetical protein